MKKKRIVAALICAAVVLTGAAVVALVLPGKAEYTPEAIPGETQSLINPEIDLEYLCPPPPEEETSPINAMLPVPTDETAPTAAGSKPAVPPSADPNAAEPKTAEPKATEPKAIEPKATELKAAEPKATEPKATEPKATEPKATEPKATEPKATEPKATEPKATEPKATEPKATEPKATEPKATEPKATEPKTTEPEATEPPATTPVTEPTSVPTEPATEPDGSEYKAPDFTVYDSNGNAVRLSDYFGKPIVLNFWASWCGPCKHEMPAFQQKYQELGDEIQFLMVNMTAYDTQADAQAVVDTNGYTFPVLFDLNGTAGRTYGISSFPTTYFIDAEGYLITGAIGAINAATLQKGIDMIR